MIPRIFQPRPNLRPYLYEKFHLAHEAVIASPWSYKEAQMSSDVLDWQNITQAERDVVGGILRGFTQIEMGATCYWRDTVARHFKQPEIVMMATSFAHQETVHTKGYDHLSATLGINSYEAFLQDELAISKLANLLSCNDEKNLINSLAIFSGAVEGVSLYASFAILLAFSKRALFKGMSQILSWSVLDEKLHSAMGIELYKTALFETGLSQDSEAIKAGFEQVVINEVAFIEQVFDGRQLKDIGKTEAIDFIQYRANKKLMELSIKPMFTVNGSYKAVKHFFDTQIEGKTQNDFFALARNGGGYSAMLSQDFHNAISKAVS